jgi:hypothetical protein
MFEVIHRFDSNVYKVYNVTDKGDGEIYFLVFMNGIFVNEIAGNFMPKL